VARADRAKFAPPLRRAEKPIAPGIARETSVSGFAIPPRNCALKNSDSERRLDLCSSRRKESIKAS